MNLIELADPHAWDQALLSLPDPHVLQSWAWGHFKSRHGWAPTRFLFQENGRTVAAASLLERRLPRLPLRVLYIPKGPALDWADTALVERVLTTIEQLARRRRALFVKIDPDVYYPDGPSQTAGPGQSAPVLDDSAPDRPGRCPARLLTRPACAPELAARLAARGWRFSAEQIQFRNTLLLDLAQGEDQLLAGMKQKTRYNVRLAARRGVVVRPGTAADLELFYRLYVETARRDRFIIRPESYYGDAWGRFIDAGLAHMLLAEVDGEAVAGLILFVFGRTAWYMYGASSEQHRDRMPNYLLQWEAIRLARSLGCTIYDLWGAPEALDEADPMWGVVRFKQGLGGLLARGLGAWDWAPRRLPYWFYAVAMPRYLAFLRARHQE